MRIRDLLVAAVFVAAIAAHPVAVRQNPAARSALWDEAAPRGENYDKAEMRLWLPPDVGRVRAVLVLNPGSNGDGRGAVEDAVWQAFATKQHVALVGTRFTDKPHEQNFIEDYVNVSKGSGPALLDALGRLAKRSNHPELESAPLLLWGMSAGGQFNYEFVAWKPERVAAFVVNKGGIYYSALLSRAARQVPGMLFVGGKDLASRTQTITGLFAVNRRGGALWALAEEPSAAHIVGRSRDLALMFYEDVLPLRLPDGDGPLKPLVERSGFIGDFEAKTFAPQGEHDAPNRPTAWLPTARLAAAWQSMVTEKPFP
jgi:poly(3-hydroxybutyrate) depolymerase